MSPTLQGALPWEHVEADIDARQNLCIYCSIRKVNRNVGWRRASIGDKVTLSFCAKCKVLHNLYDLYELYDLYDLYDPYDLYDRAHVSGRDSCKLRDLSL